MQAGLVCGSEGAWVGGVMAGECGGWQWVAEMDGRGGGGGGGGGGGAGGAGGSGSGDGYMKEVCGSEGTGGGEERGEGG